LSVCFGLPLYFYEVGVLKGVFVDVVANPKEILHYHRKKTSSSATGGATSMSMNEMEGLMADALADQMDKMQVTDLVQEFLEAQAELFVLPENGVGEAVREFVEKDDKDSINE
jgi:double-strand break repair protein MRE11